MADEAPTPTQTDPTPQTNTFALVSLISALVGLLFLGIGGLVALIFGIIGLKQIKRSGERGRGMAIAGIVMGIIELCLTLLSIVFMIGSLAFFGTLDSESFMPTSCSISGGFSCGEFAMGESGFTLEVINNLGVDTDTVTLLLATRPGSEIACTQSVDLGAMANGESAMVELCEGSYEPGQRLQASLSIEYIKARETLSHTASGTINTLVE